MKIKTHIDRISGFLTLRRIFTAVVAASVLVTFVFQLTLIWVMVRDKVLMHILKPPPVPVSVAKAIKKTVPVYLKFVGTTAAISSVDIRARVEGFLDERYFVEGDDVKEGDLMYVIDPRPFKAALDQYKAQLSKDEAALALAKKQMERYEPLARKEFISKDAFDQYVTSAKEAEAAVEADRANVEKAQLDLSYCTMYAPIGGRVGKTQVNVGNLVGAGESTVLANLVQLDPIYVYFSPSDREYLQIANQKQTGGIAAQITFSDGNLYPHEGRVDFVNNKVDQNTSTVTMRAVFPNPDKMLLPGVYVDVQLKLGENPDTVLVPERAIDETQQGIIVFTVDKDKKVETRVVETADNYDGMRIITRGLDAGETVIVEGINKVKPGMRVAPKEAPADNSQPEQES